MRHLMMAAVALMIGASAAQAQGPEALTPGKTSIAFAIPTGGNGTFGIWKQLTPTRALGIQTAVQYNTVDRDSLSDEHQFSISVTPAMKWYRSLSQSVAPFIQASAGVGYNNAERTLGGVVRETDGFNVTAAAGLGVDWFPLRNISIGGVTGLSATFGNFNENDDESTFGSFGTFTSALTMHIYF